MSEAAGITKNLRQARRGKDLAEEAGAKAWCVESFRFCRLWQRPAFLARPNGGAGCGGADGLSVALQVTVCGHSGATSREMLEARDTHSANLRVRTAELALFGLPELPVSVFLLQLICSFRWCLLFVVCGTDNCSTRVHRLPDKKSQPKAMRV